MSCPFEGAKDLQSIKQLDVHEMDFNGLLWISEPYQNLPGIGRYSTDLSLCV
jgi:hypothetical protein